MKTLSVLHSVLLIAGALLLQSCNGSSSGPARAAVSGTLKIGGQPVEGVEVHFVSPEYPEHGAYAVTDADGNFRLVQGAVVGTNTVFFSKVVGDELMLDPEDGMDAGQMEAMVVGNEGNKRMQDDLPKQIIPEEYANSNSKLTFPVPESGTSDANFDL